MKTKKEQEGGGLEAENLILENERKKRERETISMKSTSAAAYKHEGQNRGGGRVSDRVR